MAKLLEYDGASMWGGEIKRKATYLAVDQRGRKWEADQNEKQNLSKNGKAESKIAKYSATGNIKEYFLKHSNANKDMH